MEIPDLLEHLDPAVIPAKMERQVPKVLPVLQVPMVNVVLLVLLELVVSRFVFSIHHYTAIACGNIRFACVYLLGDYFFYE